MQITHDQNEGNSEMMKFRFGNSYDQYINKPNPKSVETVEKPKRFNGPILTDFDDVEDSVIAEYKDNSNAPTT